MILKNQIITNIKIESVNDLYKLKPFLEDATLKINKSQIARELEVDRCTVDNHSFTGVYCNFCHYLRKYPEFDSYFRKGRPSNTNKLTLQAIKRRRCQWLHILI